MDRGMLEEAKYLDAHIDAVDRFIASRKSNWNGKLMLVNEMSCHASENSYYYITNKDIEKKIIDVLIEYKNKLQDRLDIL